MRSVPFTTCPGRISETTASDVSVTGSSTLDICPVNEQLSVANTTGSDSPLQFRPYIVDTGCYTPLVIPDGLVSWLYPDSSIANVYSYSYIQMLCVDMFIIDTPDVRCRYMRMWRVTIHSYI